MLDSQVYNGWSLRFHYKDAFGFSFLQLLSQFIFIPAAVNLSFSFRCFVYELRDISFWILLDCSPVNGLVSGSIWIRFHAFLNLSCIVSKINLSFTHFSSVIPVSFLPGLTSGYKRFPLPFPLDSSLGSSRLFFYYKCLIIKLNSKRTPPNYIDF